MSSRRKKLLLVTVGGLIVMACIVAASSFGASSAAKKVVAASSSADLVFALDHYECYLVRPLTATAPNAVATHIVSLKDQFGPRKAFIGAATMLCNPVKKTLPSGAAPPVPIHNKLAHLFCYMQNIANSNSKTPGIVFVKNQFGEAAVNPILPAMLCLPSGKSLNLQKPAAIPRKLDHYSMWIIKTPNPYKTPSPIVLTDQFGTIQITQPLPNEAVMLGLPVLKNANTTLYNPTDHLLCHALPTPTSASSAFKPRQVLISNQFEKAARYLVVRPLELCVPSLKSLTPFPYN